MQEKEIIITNMTSKAITPPAGANWKPFTVYQIQGNDGIRYETTDGEYADSLKLGQSIKIKFKIDTKSKNGKVYTSYKIDRPRKADASMIQFKEEIFARIAEMEKNILLALSKRVAPAVAPKKEEVKEEPEQLSLFDDEEYTEDERKELDEVDNY